MPLLETTTQKYRLGFDTCITYQLNPIDLLLIFFSDYVAGGELFTHLYQREHFAEDEVRIYIGEIILALEHLHAVSILIFFSMFFFLHLKSTLIKGSFKLRHLLSLVKHTMCLVLILLLKISYGIYIRIIISDQLPPFATPSLPNRLLKLSMTFSYNGIFLSQ